MLVPILDRVVEYRPDQRVETGLGIEAGDQRGNRRFGDGGEAFHIRNMDAQCSAGKRQTAASPCRGQESAEPQKRQDGENDDNQSDNIDDVVHDTAPGSFALTAKQQPRKNVPIEPDNPASPIRRSRPARLSSVST